MSYPSIQACVAEHQTKTVLANADGTFSPIDPPTISQILPEVTAWQLTQALIELGAIDAIEAMVSTTTNPLIKYGWQKAGTYSRNDAVVVAAQAEIGWTDAQADALFMLAYSK